LLGGVRVAVRLKHFDLQVKELTAATGFTAEDIIGTLKALNLAKYWKGSGLVHARR
jgi:hypothetical protein